MPEASTAEQRWRLEGTGVRTLLEPSEPQIELMMQEDLGMAVLHVFKGGRSLTTLTGRRETVLRIAKERFGEAAVRGGR